MPKQLTYFCAPAWFLQIKELKEGIAAFYDESSGLWENVWGEHMHHGERTAALQRYTACRRFVSISTAARYQTAAIACQAQP
jgi:hypothetical protein